MVPALFAAMPRAAAFTHPGISHSRADLERMKNNLDVQPY